MRNYGAISLTQASPPQSFTEPLSLGQAAGFLNLPIRDPGDPEEDALLGAMITAARDVAECEYGRDLVPKQYDLYLDNFYTAGSFYMPGGYSRGYGIGFYGGQNLEIRLPEPLISVDLFQYRDSDGTFHSLVENTDHIVDTARALVMPAYGMSWPSFTAWPSSAVLLRFTSGYPPAHPFWANGGQRLMMGMRELISAWFMGRLPFDPAGAAGEYPYTVTQLFNYGAKRRVF